MVKIRADLWLFYALFPFDGQDKLEVTFLLACCVTYISLITYVAIESTFLNAEI